MSTLPQHIVYTYNPPGLGLRLFGKKISFRSILRSAIKKIVDAGAAYLNAQTLGAFSDYINAAKDKVMNYVDSALTPVGITQKTSAAAATLEDTEETYLADWADKYLKPYIQQLSNLLSVCEQDVSLQVKADALSKATWYMDAIQDHFSQYDFGVLTQSGIDKRNKLLEIVLEPIDAVVKAYVNEFGLNTVPYNFNPAATDFKPLLKNGTPLTNVATEKYTVPAGTVTPTASTPVNALPAPTGTVSTPVITLPAQSQGSVTPVPQVGGGKTATNVLTPVKTGNAAQVMQQVTKTPTVTPISGKGSTTTAWVVGGLATGLLIYAIAKRKNKGMNGPKKSKK